MIARSPKLKLRVETEGDGPGLGSARFAHLMPMLLLPIVFTGCGWLGQSPRMYHMPSHCRVIILSTPGRICCTPPTGGARQSSEDAVSSLSAAGVGRNASSTGHRFDFCFVSIMPCTASPCGSSIGDSIRRSPCVRPLMVPKVSVCPGRLKMGMSPYVRP